MSEPNLQTRIEIRWWALLLSLFVAAGVNGLLHELAHLFAYRILGYDALLDISAGTVFSYDSSGRPIQESLLPAVDGVLVLAAGSMTTVVLGAIFTLWFLHKKDSLALFSFAISNSVMRLSLFTDGFHSDEGVVAEICLRSIGGHSGRAIGLVFPVGVWTVSIALAWLLIREQRFFERTAWALPGLYVLCGILTLVAFAIMGMLFQ